MFDEIVIEKRIGGLPAPTFQLLTEALFSFACFGSPIRLASSFGSFSWAATSLPDDGRKLPLQSRGNFRIFIDDICLFRWIFLQIE